MLVKRMIGRIGLILLAIITLDRVLNHIGPHEE